LEVNYDSDGSGSWHEETEWVYEEDIVNPLQPPPQPAPILMGEAVPGTVNKIHPFSKIDAMHPVKMAEEEKKMSKEIAILKQKKERLDSINRIKKWEYDMDD
jgi:hypothetical protein